MNASPSVYDLIKLYKHREDAHGAPAPVADETILKYIARLKQKLKAPAIPII